MKALSFILALATVPACIAQAAEKAGAMEGYFPTDGTMMQGLSITSVLSEEASSIFNAALQKASPEKRVALMQKVMGDNVLPEYDAELWPDKEEYNKFAEAWKKPGIRPSALVGVGLQDLGNGLWRTLSVAIDPRTRQQARLPISALRYDANRNVWISSNGDLTARDITLPDGHIFGSQTGTEWVIEKKDSLSQMRESIRVTKTTDGKHIYLIYNISESSSVTGNGIMNNTLTFQFTVQKPGANLGKPGQR